MSDVEKPVVESVPPDRKADIRKKVDRLSNMLQGSTSVSGILKQRYQEALDKLKKQNTANQEVKKKIDELEKERERLKGQLEEQRKKGIAGVGNPDEAGKSDGTKGEGTGTGAGVGGGTGAGGSGTGAGSGAGIGAGSGSPGGLASGESKALGQGGAGTGTGLGEGSTGSASGESKAGGAGESSTQGSGKKDSSGSGIDGRSGGQSGSGTSQKEKEIKPDKAQDKSALGYPPQKGEEKSPELDPFKLEAQNRERELADLLKNTEAKIQAQKAEMERQSLAALNVQMLEAIKDNFKSLSKMIAETAMTPERFRSMASSYGIGLDDQLVSSMMTSLPQASTERAALQEIKGYLDGIKGGSFGAPGESTGVNTGGVAGARGKLDQAPSALKRLSLDKDGEETEEGGDHVYTVIEKIENSKIDIHSKIYNGGLGVGPMVPMPGMPGGAPMEGRMPAGAPDGKAKEGPAPGMVGPYYPPDMVAGAAPEISPADDRRERDDRRGTAPDRRKKPRREAEEAEPEAEEGKAAPEKPAEPEKKPDEDKEKSDAEKQAEKEKKEKEEAAKKAAEEGPPPPAFNPYNVSKEDDVFEEPKPVAPPAPPKPKDKKKPEEKDKDKDKAGGKDGKDNKKPEAKKEEGKEKLEISLINDDYEKYGKYLKLTYLFDNMPNNLSYSKYKKALRNACRITLLGNLEEGLNLFNELKKQKLPLEYIEMIDKNIRDVKYYLRGKFRSSEADLE